MEVGGIYTTADHDKHHELFNCNFAFPFVIMVLFSASSPPFVPPSCFCLFNCNFAFPLVIMVLLAAPSPPFLPPAVFFQVFSPPPPSFSTFSFLARSAIVRKHSQASTRGWCRMFCTGLLLARCREHIRFRNVGGSLGTAGLHVRARTFDSPGRGKEGRMGEGAGIGVVGT
jgi:hypothetical protein